MHVETRNGWDVSVRDGTFLVHAGNWNDNWLEFLEINSKNLDIRTNIAYSSAIVIPVGCIFSLVWSGSKNQRWGIEIGLGRRHQLCSRPTRMLNV